MANVFAFEGFVPVIHESAFVHPNATVTGNVVIGRDVYVGPGAAIRGDWGGIVIADGCNVQESCTIHMFPGVVGTERGTQLGEHFFRRVRADELVALDPLRWRL